MLCRLVNKVMHFSHMRPSGVCLWVNARKSTAAIVKVKLVVKAIMIMIVMVIVIVIVSNSNSSK